MSGHFVENLPRAWYTQVVEILWSELKQLRERQDEDFEAVMKSFAVQRTVIHQLVKQQEELLLQQKELSRQQDEQAQAFASYRNSSRRVLGVMEALITQTQSSTTERLSRLEERVSRLERSTPPAA